MIIRLSKFIWNFTESWSIELYYAYLIRKTSFLVLDVKTRNEPQCEKTNNVDSDQVWHKPGCAATENG